MHGKSGRLAILCVTISVLSLVAACGGASAPAATATMARPVATTATTNSTSPWGITLLSVYNESYLPQRDVDSITQGHTNSQKQNGDTRLIVVLDIQNNSGTVMGLVDPTDPNSLSTTPNYAFTRVWAQVKADNDFAYPKYPAQISGTMLIAPGFQVHAPVEIDAPSAVTGTAVIVHVEMPGGTGSIEVPKPGGFSFNGETPTTRVNIRSFSLPISSIGTTAIFDRVTYPVTSPQPSGKPPLTINATGLNTSCLSDIHSQTFTKISLKLQITNQYGYSLGIDQAILTLYDENGYAWGGALEKIYPISLGATTSKVGEFSTPHCSDHKPSKVLVWIGSLSDKSAVGQPKFFVQDVSTLPTFQ